MNQLGTMRVAPRLLLEMEGLVTEVVHSVLLDMKVPDASGMVVVVVTLGLIPPLFKLEPSLFCLHIAHPLLFPVTDKTTFSEANP